LPVVEDLDVLGDLLHCLRPQFLRVNPSWYPFHLNPPFPAFYRNVGLHFFQLTSSPVQMQTVVFLLLVFTNQACIYVLRTDGRLWSFAPGRWMALASVGDIILVSGLAVLGWLMAPLPAVLVLGLLVASAVFALLLDQAKRYVFQHFAIV